MSLPPVFNLTGNRYGVYRGDTYGPKQFQLGRIVRASIALGDDDLTATSSVFQSADAGIQIFPLTAEGLLDNSLPALTTISSYVSGSHVVLSAPAVEAVVNGLFLIKRRDITGHVFTGQIRPDRESSTVSASISASVVNVNGLIAISMATAVTAAIPAGSSFVWDLQSTPDSGVTIKTWFTGTVEVEGDVTR